MLYTKIQEAEPKQIDNINISAGFPFKEKWELLDNLKLLAEDEELEAEAYDEFIKTANEEGFDEIAHLFEMIMEVEIRHKNLFNELYKQFKDKTI